MGFSLPYEFSKFTSFVSQFHNSRRNISNKTYGMVPYISVVITLCTERKFLYHCYGILLTLWSDCSNEQNILFERLGPHSTIWNGSQSLWWTQEERKKALWRGGRPRRLLWPFYTRKLVVAVCFTVACDCLSFLSLIFIYEFYFLINGKRNSNIQFLPWRY